MKNYTEQRRDAAIDICATTFPDKYTKTNPVVNVQAAITHITATLNWMHSSKKTGGLGYAISRVKLTNAYKALTDLGGTWN